MFFVVILRVRMMGVKELHDMKSAAVISVFCIIVRTSFSQLYHIVDDDFC